MKKILFVCLGNICRSPMAEAIFNHKVKKLGIEGQLYSNSAGTADYHIGETPDPRTIETVQRNEIEINHRGQQFQAHHAKEFDYLIAMDLSNKNDMLTRLNEEYAEKIFLMREFDLMGKGDVPDPWYGGISGFNQVFEILDHSIDEFIAFLRKKYHL